MADQKTLERRVTELEARNQRVEADKGWETSWLRRLTIMVVTYLTVVFYLKFVVHIDPWINALVPVIGYSVSTLSLDFIKKQWARRKSG